MNIVYDYVPESSKKRTGRKMEAQSLTIHSTANPASTAPQRAGLSDKPVQHQLRRLPHGGR